LSSIAQILEGVREGEREGVSAVRIVEAPSRSFEIPPSLVEFTNAPGFSPLKDSFEKPAIWRLGTQSRN